MRALGLDLGSKRIGVAVSDDQGRRGHADRDHQPFRGATGK